MIGFAKLFEIANGYTLHTYTHTLVSTVISFLPLLGIGFQRLKFPFLLVLELSPANLLTESLSPPNCPAYISVQTAQKTPLICCGAIVAYRRHDVIHYCVRSLRHGQSRK
jgi:hypothetical protein